MKINKSSPYLFEFLLGSLVLIFLHLLNIDLHKATLQLSKNLGILFTIYGAVIALCSCLLLVLINESDTEFIKWLILKKAESSYRNAAIFTLCSFCFGMIFIGINNMYVDTYIISIIALYLVILNTIQVFQMFILFNNYVSLKRKWQELR